MTWTKEPPIPGKIVGCLCCGGNKDVYPLNSIFAVGFGFSGITKDGETIYSEDPSDDRCPTLTKFEKLAKKDPDHDWRMFRHAPLRSAEYQRHGDGAWVLIREGLGFA